MILECNVGAIILTPVTAAEFLVVLTDSTRSLGHLTYQIAGSGPRIAAVI